MMRERRERAIYRRLARVLPAPFRESAGADLEEAALACLRRERARLGPLGSIYGWTRITWDLAACALSMRPHRNRPFGHDPFGLGREVHPGRGREIVTGTARDVRYALRSLRRQPGFTAIAVLTLALGFGASTAVFTVLSSVLWRPLPYPDSDRLLFITSEFSGQGFSRFPMSVPEYVDVQSATTTLASVGGYSSGAVNLGAEQPARVTRTLVTPDLLQTLGVRPRLGRPFTAQDAAPGAPAVAIVSHGLWQRVFGGDAGLLGRRVPLNDVPTEIVGVMPPGFDVRDSGTDVLEPLTIDPASFPATRTSHSLYLIGRLAPGVTLEQARADVERVLSTWETTRAGTHTLNVTHHRVSLQPLKDDVVRGASTPLWLLQGTVLAVLLIACVNLTTLLLARTDARLREYAVRAALGASRRRLFRHVVTEGLLLALVGSASGIGIAYAGLRVLLAVSPEGVPRVQEIAIDRTVLLATVAAACIAGVAISSLPFLRTRTAGLGPLLGQAGSRSLTRGRTALRSGLVVIQTAVAVMLVVAAGLLIQTVWNLTSTDAGFDRRGLTTFSVVLPSASYSGPERLRFQRDVMERLQTLPGVTRVAAMTGLPPLRRPNITDTDFEHIPNGRPHGEPPIENVDFYQTVSADYVETLGIRVAEGRAFDPADVAGEPVALVNQTLASTFFPDRSAIGGRVKPPWGGFDNMPWFTIVGVLEDVKQGGMGEPPGTELYLLADQITRLAGFTSAQMHFAMRSSRSAESLAPDVRRTVADLDAGLPIVGLRSMEDVIDGTIATPRFVMLLLTLFAAVALSLAAVGIYGVLAFLVSERAREFGIRIALGADRRRILRMVLRRGLVVSAVGLALGLAGSVVTTRLTESFLYGVAASDLRTRAAVGAVVLAAATLACLVPALRATRADPVDALRAE